MDPTPSSQHRPNPTAFQLLWWSDLRWHWWAVCVGARRGFWAGQLPVHSSDNSLLMESDMWSHWSSFVAKANKSDPFHWAGEVWLESDGEISAKCLVWQGYHVVLDQELLETFLLWSYAPSSRRTLSIEDSRDPKHAWGRMQHQHHLRTRWLYISCSANWCIIQQALQKCSRKAGHSVYAGEFETPTYMVG